jgi:hypothetical protein
MYLRNDDKIRNPVAKEVPKHNMPRNLYRWQADLQ